MTRQTLIKSIKAIVITSLLLISMDKCVLQVGGSVAIVPMGMQVKSNGKI